MFKEKKRGVSPLNITPDSISVTHIPELTEGVVNGILAFLMIQVTLFQGVKQVINVLYLTDALVA
jgi:hypothetical protein